MNTLKSIIKIIEGISETAGKIAMWLSSTLVLLICFDVLARYFFSVSFVSVFELEWHIFALIFLFGASFTLKYDKHVRVDIFYNQFSDKQKALVNLLGCLFFLIPFCYIVIESSVPYFMNSYYLNEGSTDYGGLPARYIIKSMIMVGFILLLLQGVALFFRSLLTLFNK
ncbi:TRAP transporter small permease subunit [Chondrinema litorale]|uniref:TRAP transporter small permease subunit n=1 Tax=Chondrinema litorale TaxID=2994555 RepID=UPI002542EA1B|nr:TRAP transporter small permease subunit [Chondrinema litorale]UZR92281.1 TRAP transporter small permease subunit [Chondrinema litorale]